MPTTIAVHLEVDNPNSVLARMVTLGWTFGEVYEVGAGRTVDVVVPVTFNACDLNMRSTQDLFYLGLALAGVEGYAKTVSMDLAPIVETERSLIPSTEPIKVSR